MLNPFASIKSTCGSMLCELQKIWDEVGEPDVERDKTILEIEQECLAVYGSKVDKAKSSKAQLQQAIASAESEIADICSSLGERPLHFDLEACRNLKEKFETIVPQLEDACKRKVERKNQFVEVLNQLREISNEIYSEDNSHKFIVAENDLSVKKLEDLQRQFVDLQNEKSNRLQQVLDHLSILNSLCVVLGVDFRDIICKIHPSLDDSSKTKDISDNTLEKLAMTIQSFQEVKIQRMHKIQDLATHLLELWNLMDTPIEEQWMFQNVTKNIAASEPEVTEPNMLSIDNIKHVEGEVLRLEHLKGSKMKELVLKRRLELEEICKKVHMVTGALGEYSTAVESGSVDPVYLLEQIELQIANIKEEAFSRREILERVEKWFAAREEECWLEEYSRDDNRYKTGRGSHLTLKRAEKARALVNKIPVMVETLTSKVTAWEKERGFEFLYDGVRLLSVLEEYSSLRQEKEQERQKQRDQKRLQGQLMAQREALYGSKPCPSKSGKKATRPLTGTESDRKLSLGGEMLHNLKAEKVALDLHSNKKFDSFSRSDTQNHQQSGGLATCSGRRNSEIGGHLVNMISAGATKARQIESNLGRKPLSPVPLAISSKANIANFLEDQKRPQTETIQKTLAGIKTTLVVTPSKPTLVGNQGIRTPKKMPIPVPATPSTVTVPMLMATTPATPFASLGANKAVKRIVENVEYSFEEVRAGFICP